MWAFNEEVVAEAIFKLNTFVVSAVGHEIDVLISDFVADLRAPTPSASIEMILPDQNEVLYTLSEIENRYARTIGQILASKEQSLTAFSQEFARHSVSRKIAMVEKEFKNLEDEFQRVMDYKLTQFETKVISLPKLLRENFEYALNIKTQSLNSLKEKINLYNPKLKQKDGWAEVVLDGKRVALSEIKEDDRFTLANTTVKLEVVCLNKESMI